MSTGTSEGEDWIGRRVRLAREAALIPDKTANAAASLMRDRLAERQLPAGEITRLAKDLVETLKGGTASDADR